VISSESEWGDESPTWPSVTVGKRVLVAEDDAAMRDLLTLVLRERGYEVDCVGSGTEMPSVLAECRPQGALADRFDLIVVTAFPQPDIRERARGLEVRLLAKPFDLDTLRSAVDWAIRANAPHEQRLPWS
jgi:hypothetical protein